MTKFLKQGKLGGVARLGLLSTLLLFLLPAFLIAETSQDSHRSRATSRRENSTTTSPRAEGVATEVSDGEIKNALDKKFSDLEEAATKRAKANAVGEVDEKN